MNQYEAFVLYTGLKLHFSSKYDFFKYNGKSKISTVPVYEKRKDKRYFIKLSHHADPKGLVIANLIRNPAAWIGDIICNDGEQVYQDWVSRQQSLTYRFKLDLEQINNPEGFDGALKCTGDLPLALKQYIAGNISLETLTLLAEITGCYTHWEKRLKDDILWKQIRTIIPKYVPFLPKTDTFKNIILNHYK